MQSAYAELSQELGRAPVSSEVAERARCVRAPGGGCVSGAGGVLPGVDGRGRARRGRRRMGWEQEAGLSWRPEVEDRRPCVR